MAKLVAQDGKNGLSQGRAGRSGWIHRRHCDCIGVSDFKEDPMLMVRDNAEARTVPDKTKDSLRRCLEWRNILELTARWTHCLQYCLYLSS